MLVLIYTKKQKYKHKFQNLFCHPALDAGSSDFAIIDHFLDPRFRGDDKYSFVLFALRYA